MCSAADGATAQRRVLVLAAGGVVGYGIIDALSQSATPYWIEAACISPGAAGLFLADGAQLSPYARDPSFIDWLTHVCTERRIDIVLAGQEDVLEVLAGCRKQILEATGTVVGADTLDRLLLTRDKLRMNAWLADHEVDVADTVDLSASDDVAAFRDRHSPPWVVKPRFGSGARGVEIIDSVESLQRRAGGRDLLLQEHLGVGVEHTVACLCDADGEVRGSVAFERKLTHGCTTWARLLQSDVESLEITESICRELGATGPCNAQFLHRASGAPVCIDVNLRFSSTVALRAAGGFADADAAVAMWLGERRRNALVFSRNGIAVRRLATSWVPEDAHENLLAGGRVTLGQESPAAVKPTVNQENSSDSQTRSVRLVGPLASSDIEELQAALGRGRLAARGPAWRAVRDIVSSVCDAPCISLTSSGTMALEVGAMALDLELGDEVIVPAFTYVTTASAFARQGAHLRFADVHPDTLTMDPSSVDSLLGPRTKAIVTMHYGGVACDLDRLASLTQESDVALVEDNAHGFCGGYRGHALGSFGRFSIVSFDWTKNFTCGEGGAILATDPDLARRIETITDRGTNRRAFERGEARRYEWIEIGTNGDLSELSAACLLGQLRRREQIQERRRQVWQAHDEALGPWADTNGVALPRLPQECEPAFHIYFVLLPNAAARPEFIEHLARRGVEGLFHYSPLHTSPFGRMLAGPRGDCPVAESAADRIVRIPVHDGLEQGDLDVIHEAVTSAPL